MTTREIQIANQNLLIQELDNLYDSVTGRPLTGSWLWNSSIILSLYIATQGENHFPLTGKSVIELGAGAGLPGLTAARLGASRVVLTDIEALVPGLVKNVEVNGLGDRVEVRKLVWGSDELGTELNELGEFDLVLMSDVFFDIEDITNLAKTVKRVCRKGTRIWATSEIRPWTSECLHELINQGFEVVELLGNSEGNENSELFVVFELIPPNEENVNN